MGDIPTLTIEEGTFVFMRDTDSERRGSWYPCQSRGIHPASVAVPMDFGKDLTELARARGVAELFNFALHPPEPVKKPREKSEKSSAPAVVKSGFNPFKAQTPSVGVAPPAKKRDLNGDLIKAGKAGVVKAGKK